MTSGYPISAYPSKSVSEFNFLINPWLVRLAFALILVISSHVKAQAVQLVRVNDSSFSSGTLTYSVAILLQVEQEPNTLLDQGMSGVNCMRARARVRNYERVSWLAATALALLIYYGWLLLAPRFLSSGGKWLISPILASLLVAVLVAAFENSQLTQACEEPSGWRFDAMSTIFLMNWLFFVLLIFIAFAVLRYFRLRRRMAALKTS
ncbi:MAG TPA: hypothetical protein VJ875_15590 [Pyrinomonadaceae bacterium]|nr:hypothetical protein [Pyrinomonadaceae bacterium]